MTSGKPDPALYAGDLFGEFYQGEQADQPKRLTIASLVPGIATCLIVAFAALWLAQQYGFPAILAGLLLGLALHFLSDLPSLADGLDFVSKHFLRVGIVLLGLQVSLTQIVDLGLVSILGLALIMGAAFAAALVGAKLAGQDRYSGVLAGGATAICGASAALALYAIVGRDRLDQTRFTLTLVGITLASAFALTTYPAIAAYLELSDKQAGFLVGSSIHDVAQAIGGGYAVSDEAGGQATLIKLARVALLAPVVALVALWIGQPQPESTKRRRNWGGLVLPWFIVGFLTLVALNSFMPVPKVVAERGLELSKFLLLVAVTATALRSRLSLLLEAGWTPLIPIFASTLASFAVSLMVAIFLIG
jgi:uncharacterized integral membrane protein (TIGR00698 family)